MEEPNRRLELRFRPDDVFCKPACGEKHPSSSLLLRFHPSSIFILLCPLGLLLLFQYQLSRVKKRKLKAGREGKGKPAVKFDTSIEGVVPTTYRWAPYHPNVGLKLVKVWQSL